MSKDELLERIKEIQQQDKAAMVAPRNNDFTQGYVEGHLSAYNSIEKFIEELV